jgi:MFS family permease
VHRDTDTDVWGNVARRGPPPVSVPPNRHASSLLVLLTGAQLLVTLDFTIVQVALPSIQSSLSQPISVIQWVVIAYGITLASFLLLCGRAGDYYGHKRLFILGLLAFSISSMGAGFSQNASELILARAIQGAGAALGSATSLSILVWIFPEGNSRNRALGLFGGALGSGFVIGMISSGIVTTYLGWRWVFFIVVPIGATFAALSARLLPIMPRRSETVEHAYLDFPGALTITAALILFVLGLGLVQLAHIVTETAALAFAGCGVLMFSFFEIELRSPEPILPRSFLKRRAVMVADTVALLFVTAFAGSIFELSFLLQRLLSFSPLETGFAFAPQGLLFFLVSAGLAPRYLRRTGFRLTVLTGGLIAAAGFLLLATVSVHSSYWLSVLPATSLVGFGTGFAFEAYNVGAFTGTQRGEEGLASGLINTARQMGIPVGTAVLVTVAELGGGVGDHSSSGFDWAFTVAAALVIGAVVVAFLASPESPSRVPPTAVSAWDLHD